MRPKIVIGILGIAILLMAGLVALRPSPLDNQGSVPDERDGSLALGGVQAGFGSSQKPAIPPRLPARSKNRVYAGEPNAPEPALAGSPQLSNDELSPEAEDALNDRIWELSELASETGPGAFHQIVCELTNRAPQIRKAALEALMQMGNADAIPVLKDVAAHSRDPKEKADIAEAIKFISLPSLAEVSSSPKRAATP